MGFPKIEGFLKKFNKKFQDFGLVSSRGETIAAYVPVRRGEKADIPNHSLAGEL